MLYCINKKKMKKTKQQEEQEELKAALDAFGKDIAEP